MKPKQKIGIGEDFPNVLEDPEYTNGSLFIRTDLPGLPTFQLENLKSNLHWRKILGVDISMTTAIDQLVTTYIEVQPVTGKYALALQDRVSITDINDETRWLPRINLVEFALLTGVYNFPAKSAIKAYDVYPETENPDDNNYFVATIRGCSIDVSHSYGVVFNGQWVTARLVGNSQLGNFYDINDLTYVE